MTRSMRAAGLSNPSLQDADLPGMRYLREQVTEARGMPSKEAMVRRLNFGEWTGAERRGSAQTSGKTRKPNPIGAN